MIGDGFVSRDLLDRLADSIEQARTVSREASLLFERVAGDQRPEEYLDYLSEGVESLASLDLASEVASEAEVEIEQAQARVDREILRRLSGLGPVGGSAAPGSEIDLLFGRGLFLASQRDPGLRVLLTESSTASGTWAEAVSRYLGGVALAATRPCEDVSAVAPGSPPIRSRLSGRLGRSWGARSGARGGVSSPPDASARRRTLW